MVGIKIAIVCFVAMADMSGGKPAVANVPETPPAVVVETTVAPTIPPATVPAPPKSDGFVAYSVHGRTPPIEWQRYLYDQLASLGIAWYYPYAVCQIQQESCWSQWSDNGVDQGITQQKAVYWADRSAYWGIPGASIWDVYAQFYVYARQMASFLGASGGDVGKALSLYFLGYDGWAQFYIDCVMSHWGALEAIR